MGHIRLGTLPTSKKWREVVELLSGNASLEEIASAAARAAELDLKRASGDPVFQYVAKLLVELPLMARMPASDADAFDSVAPVNVTSPESVTALLSSINEAIEHFTFEQGRSSDIGLMAQSALLESLSVKLRDRLPSLFDPQPSDIRSALGQFAGGQPFGELARDFFARLTYKSLDYYLSRELANHTETEARFAGDAERVSFERALFQHSFEASRIVEEFAGGWYGKTVWRDQNLSDETIRQFTDYGFNKMRSELGRRR
jgi:hypothetical protein